MAQCFARITGHHGVRIGALKPKLHSNMDVSKSVSVHQQMAHEGRSFALAAMCAARTCGLASASASSMHFVISCLQ
jgi:hypothetical protein